MASFRSSIAAVAPPWLRGPVAARFLYGFGAVMDATAEWMRQGVLARFPGAGAPDALPYIGRDRQIVRGFAESADSYAERLRRWLDDWRVAGSPISVLAQLRGYLLGVRPVLRTVDNTGNWHSLDASDVHTWSRGANWNWDGLTARWWRWWAIVYSSAGPWETEGTWSDGSTSWGDGGTWGTTATTAEVETLRAILAQWRSAHALPQWIVVAFDPDSFDPTAPEPDGTWGTWSVDDGGIRRPSRLGSARYIDGA